MLAVEVRIEGLADLDGAVARGRDRALPLLIAEVQRRALLCQSTQTDPWGRAWAPRSAESDGAGPLLPGVVEQIAIAFAGDRIDAIFGGIHGTSHQFGRAKKRGSGRSRRRAIGPAPAPARGRSASRGNSREPARAFLPLRVRNSGRSEPLLDWPDDWLRALDAILDREIQAEIDALRGGLA